MGDDPQEMASQMSRSVARCECKSWIGFATSVVALNALLLLAVPDFAVGQPVPTINIVPSCKAAAAGYIGLTQEFDSCRRSEEAAREVLVKEWNNFSASDRGSCYRLTTTGTPGTYTELLTCLEMRRDARALPTQDQIRKDPQVKPRGSRSKQKPDPQPTDAAR